MIAAGRPAVFNAQADAVRRRLLRPWSFKAYLWLKLPLAACAGLSLRQLDEAGCTVGLPGGWRTQNPFRSTYFAAQAMAAEMSTGAPAMVLVRGAPASVSMILREIEAAFTRKIQGPSQFTFDDVAGLSAAVDRAASSGESESYTGRSVGRGPDGEPAAEFRVTWSFKRRT
ncbi:MAG: thioesterase [Acidobacteria bacterium]|nr:MAG: thioesterase [Acidobacteriota bacterium]